MNENQDTLDEVSVGRILHFVIPSGKCRPAITVEDWQGNGQPGLCNLVVFPDGSNDGKYGVDDHTHQTTGSKSIDPRIFGDGVIAERTGSANLPLLVGWETSVHPNHAVKAIRTWHWPRECKGLHPPASPFTDENKETWHHNHVDGMRDPHNCPGCIAEARYAKENIPT